MSWWEAIKELWRDARGKTEEPKPWLPPHSWPHDKPLPPPPEKKK